MENPTVQTPPEPNGAKLKVLGIAIILIAIVFAVVLLLRPKKTTAPDQLPAGITQEEHESHHPELYNKQ